DRREDLPPERREGTLVHDDPRAHGREFHASHSWLQREPPLARQARRAVCERRAKNNGARNRQPPVWKKDTTPLATVTMLMHSTPKTNCTPHAVGDPLIRPLTIARQVM